MLIPEQVAQLVRKSIIKREIEPCSQLDPDALARDFCTKRTIIVQGLRQLAEEGFIVYDESDPIVADVNETFDLRILLECEALRLAIPNHTEALWNKAEALLDEIDATRGDNWNDQNCCFHKLLYSASKRPRLLCMISALHATSDHIAPLIRGYKQSAQEQHRQILETCRRRDVEGACKLLIEHINQRRTHLFNSAEIS